MSPGIKYSFARVGLFVVCAGAAWFLLPDGMNQFLKLLIGLVVSMPLSYVLLRRWRDEMADQLSNVQARRISEKQRLQAALSGADPDAPPTPTPSPAPDDGDAPTKR